MPVVIIVADGARPDTLAAAMDRGLIPELARLRNDGALCTVTSVFPSVTGPAYTPFVMGRYPGPIGLPGLRWYDRERTTLRMPGNSRSYVGPEMRRIDADLDPDAPTMFELAGSSLAALNVIGRGLHSHNQIGRTIGFTARAARTHFTGDVEGWLAIDRDIARQVTRQIRTTKPDFVFAALTGIDKTSHLGGHAGRHVDDAMQIVDETIAEIRSDAERANTWDSMHLWVVSDHGHSRVTSHDGIDSAIAGMGFRTISHPFVFSMRGEVAVMVSGNAMAHIYLDLQRRERPWLPQLGGRWAELRQALLERESVDIMILPASPGSCEVHGRGRGHALITWDDGLISYEPITGDPLGVGLQRSLDDREAYEATVDTDYPDSLVQIARLSDSPRSGEIILSASRDWDFRARYEPIPHTSSHGALHREHMLVPLLMNRAPSGIPRRTVDVMPSACRALGIRVPGGVDGVAFV